MAKKEKIFFLLLILLGNVCINRAFAASSSINAQASVKVASVFNITVDSSNVGFGGVNPGEFKEIANSNGYANAVVCKSNTGNAWNLKIKANSPLSFGANSIPVQNFKWMSTYAGNKNAPYDNLSSGLNHKPADGYVNFSLIDESVYTSAQASYNDNSNLPNGSEIQFKYAVQVPDNPSPPSGAYSSTVTFTLTE